VSLASVRFALHFVEAAQQPHHRYGAIAAGKAKSSDAELAQNPLRASLMECGIFHEESLQPEAMLPVQFNTIWHGGRPITPERALVITMLWQAAHDLQKNRFAKRRRQQRLYIDAYKWVASEDRSWPYSFVNLCEAINVSPAYLCEELLNVSVRRRRPASEVLPFLEEAA